ncbi:MAG: SIS domain-containing protein [Nitrospirae bacterium]|nr:MAG: SIS domain-containing protein [Nitrospirota bacterium]
MREFAENYYSNLFGFISSIRVTDKSGGQLTFSHGIEKAGNLIALQTASGQKIIFIGNGGSAAISSHMAIDFWKNGGMKAISFNDGPQLTCIGNDYGYKHVFEKPIEMFTDSGDVLVAISSSGKSENILLGVQAAKLKGCRIITLSGFDERNPLSGMGEFNFYVPSRSYGPVEVIHHSICHCIIDTIMKGKSG